MEKLARQERRKRLARIPVGHPDRKASYCSYMKKGKARMIPIKGRMRIEVS
jgi:hypothetical protein